MQVISLEIENILSIEKASITFEESGLVLVEGWNYDTQRANGAGKTAIFNCMSFALFDKLPRKITASEILKRGCKTGFARCSVLCGDDTWTVQRTRPKGVEFFKNGNKEEITQSEFESKIKLSYTQFLLTIYTPQANSRNYTRFLGSPDASKKEFLLQLLNLDSFDSVKKIVDEKVKQFQSALDLIDNKLNQARSKKSAYEESLLDISAIEDHNNSLKKSVEDANLKILELSNVNKPDLSKFAKLEEDARSKLNHILQSKTKKTMLHDKYRELINSINEYDADAKCNECGSSLDTEEARVAHSSHQEKIKQKVSEIKSQIDDLDTVCSKEQAFKNLLNQIREKKEAQSKEFTDAQLEMRDLKSLINNCNDKLQSNSRSLNHNSDLLIKVNELSDRIVTYLSEIEQNKKDLELYKTLSQFYSSTGAQAYVLDSIVDSFNEIVQKYIELLSPSMSYSLNSFKETSDGSVVAKFSETLIKNGEQVSVGSLSGGEEKALSLCVDFALLDVLETQFSMKLNPIVLDEPFDGLDTAGREIVIELLEELARNRQIFVIDHSSEAKAMFTKTIRVELRNNTSTINIES